MDPYHWVLSITTWILMWMLCAFLSICLFLFCVKTFWDGSRFKEFMGNLFIIIFSCKVNFFSHHHHYQFINIFSQSWVLNFVCVCACVCVYTLFLFPFAPNKHNGFWFQVKYQVGISNSVSFSHQFTSQAFFILWWVFISSKYVKKKVFQLCTWSALNWSLYTCHLIILKSILGPNKVWIVKCRIDFGSRPT